MYLGLLAISNHEARVGDSSALKLQACCFISFGLFLYVRQCANLFQIVIRIPWNGKQDILIDRYFKHFDVSSAKWVEGREAKRFCCYLLICCHIDRFDGRALLDFIRDTGSHRRASEKSEEEQELEEFVNFERYRDLIKHRRRGCRYFFDSFNHPSSFIQSVNCLF